MKTGYVKMYTDEDSNEILLAISPIDEKIKKTIVEIIQAVYGDVVQEIKSVEGLAPDKTYAENEQKSPVFVIPMTNSSYGGLTPMQAVTEKNGFVDLMQWCMTNKADKDYSEYADTLKKYLNGIDANQFSMQESNDKVEEFKKICPNLVNRLTENLDMTDILNVHIVVQKLISSAVKFL